MGMFLHASSAAQQWAAASAALGDPAGCGFHLLSMSVNIPIFCLRFCDPKALLHESPVMQLFVLR